MANPVSSIDILNATYTIKTQANDKFCQNRDVIIVFLTFAKGGYGFFSVRQQDYLQSNERNCLKRLPDVCLRPRNNPLNFHRSRRPSTVHVAPSRRSLLRPTTFLAALYNVLLLFMTTFIRPSYVYVQCSAPLYRPSTARLATTSQFI